MKLTNAAIVALVLTTPASVIAQEGPRKDGQWEVTVEMDMPGMPFKMPAQTAKRCVTKEEAEDPQKALPQAQTGRNTNPNSCKVSDYKAVGNTVTWAMKCEPPQEMSGTGEITYTENAYKGTMKMQMAGGQAMTMKYSGKRLGDCVK